MKQPRSNVVCASCKTRESPQWWKAPKGLSSTILCDDCGISWRKYADFTKPVIREESVPASTKSKTSVSEKREGTPLSGPNAKRSKVWTKLTPHPSNVPNARTPCRQRSRSHPHLQPSLRINAWPATTTAPSGRLSNAKNAVSKPTRERTASSPNRWKWTIGYASCVRTIRCKRRRWIRLACFVPRSNTIRRTGFIRLRIPFCGHRSLRRGRDGCI